MTQPAPVNAQRVYPLVIGVEEGVKGNRQLQRAEQLLKREGFKCGIASPETLRLLLQRLDDGTDPDPNQKEESND